MFRESYSKPWEFGSSTGFPHLPNADLLPLRRASTGLWRVGLLLRKAVKQVTLQKRHMLEFGLDSPQFVPKHGSKTPLYLLYNGYYSLCH